MTLSVDVGDFLRLFETFRDFQISKTLGFREMLYGKDEVIHGKVEVL